MKKINRRFLFFIVMSFIVVNSFGQEITPSDSEPQCPGYFITYQVAVSEDNLVSAQWTVTGGEIRFGYQNGSTSTWYWVSGWNTIDVKWYDNVEVGNISAEFTHSNSTYHPTISKNFAIKSIANRTPAVSGISSPVDFGVDEYTIGVTLNYPNKVPADADPVNNIKFTLPAGWSYNNYVSNGSHVYSKSGPMDITTDSSSGGMITIWGESNCNYGANSQVYSLNITRKITDFDILVSSENNFLEGNITSFTASAPNWAGVSYTWSVSSNWSYSGSGSSIVVVPDGCDGSISCTITYGSSSETTVKSIDFQSGIYSISGNQLVCSSGQPFELATIPNGSTITWSQSSNLTRTSVQGSNPCTFVANGSGSGWVGATVLTPCGSTVNCSQRSIWAGPPLAYGINWKTWPANYEEVSYQADASISYLYYPLNYTWSVSPSSGVSLTPNDNGSSADVVFYNSGYYTLGVCATNSCGTGSYYYEQINVADSIFLMMSPNPTIGETTVSIESSSKVKTVDENIEWDMEIYNQGKMKKEKKTKLKGLRYTLNTSGWEVGVYIVRAVVDDKILTGKLVVTK